MYARPLNELPAREVVRGVRQGTFTAEAVARACLDRIATREIRSEGVGLHRSRSRAAPGARARPPESEGRAPWPNRRREGHLRHARHAHRHGLADLSQQPPDDRRLVRRAGARGRRGHPRQDHHLRVRGPHAERHAQPARSRAHTGRLLQRLGRRRRRPHGSRRVRHADRRLRASARLLLRRCRLQADLQHHQPRRHEIRRRKSRHHRPLRAHRRGHRPRRGRAHRPRAFEIPRHAAQDRSLPHEISGSMPRPRPSTPSKTQRSAST